MKKSLPFCAWVSPPSTAPDNGLSRGLPSALIERRRPGAIHKLDGKQEAFLVALACTPPAGRVHWTMQLLAERLVTLQLVEAISDETVRRVLKKKNDLKPWQRKEWCIPV